MSTRNTYRLFEGETRVSTAVSYKDKILQVHPKIQEFASLEEWETAWALTNQLGLLLTKSEIQAKQTKKPLLKFSPLDRRREQEFAEYLEVDYAWLISSVRRVDKETLEIVLNDGRKIRVKRSNEYLYAPQIWIDDIEILKCREQYSPALTSIRWLLMLLFVQS